MPRNIELGLLVKFPELAPVFKAKDSMGRESGRYAFHKYLTEVYRVGRCWSREKIRKRRTRELKRLTKIRETDRLHAFRVIIKATYPSLCAKTASRWTRSLELAILEKVRAAKLDHFFRKKGGVAKCAREAASEIPKRRYRRPTWD